MKIARWFWLSAFLVACGGVVADGGPPNKDGGEDVHADALGTAQCCPPDPSPGCCMDFGGWSNGNGCQKTCDGMPQPGDPGWKLVKDDHGCAMWSNPKPIWSSGTCGAPPPFDGGKDTAPD